MDQLETLFALPPVNEWLYVCRRGTAHGYQVKIGWTRRDPLERCADLKADLIDYFPGSRADEQELHRRFSSSRIDREWYMPTDDLLDWIYPHTLSLVIGDEVWTERVTPRQWAYHLAECERWDRERPLTVDESDAWCRLVGIADDLAGLW